MSNGTMWVTQKAMADIFDTDKSEISKHLKNIFTTNELDVNSVVAKFATTAIDGKTYKIEHYNLDATISVGYRVNSSKATKFRQWATSVLIQYVKDGYVIDRARLEKDPEKQRKLASEIRELRHSQKSRYAIIKDLFKISAIDYKEKTPKELGLCFALIQDKFHYAVTGMTAGKLKLDRANHRLENMGVQSISGNLPNQQEAKVEANYLSKDKLYLLYILSEQFLLYTESMSLRDKSFNIKQLEGKLDELLRVNDYKILEGYANFEGISERAKNHVAQEYQTYIDIEILKLEIPHFNLELYYDDEYLKELRDIKERMTARQITTQINKHFEEKKLKIQTPTIPTNTPKELDSIAKAVLNHKIDPNAPLPNNTFKKS